MSTTSIIIALLGVLVGYIVQSVNTGSLFGQITIPKPWLPWLTLAGTFLAAFVASIVQAPTKDNTAWFNALLAGLMALVGNTAGVTMKQHVDAHKGVAEVPPTKT